MLGNTLGTLGTHWDINLEQDGNYEKSYGHLVQTLWEHQISKISKSLRNQALKPSSTTSQIQPQPKPGTKDSYYGWS
jgi:hypothetical protein